MVIPTAKTKFRRFGWSFRQQEIKLVHSCQPEPYYTSGRFTQVLFLKWLNWLVLISVSFWSDLWELRNSWGRGNFGFTWYIKRFKLILFVDLIWRFFVHKLVWLRWSAVHAGRSFRAYVVFIRLPKRRAMFFGCMWVWLFVYILPSSFWPKRLDRF